MTSATLGNEDQNAEVAEFASRLCNSYFEKDNIIRAMRQNPQATNGITHHRQLSMYHDLAMAINEENDSKILSEIKALSCRESNEAIQAQVYDLVVADKNYWNVRSVLQEKPQTVYHLADRIGCTIKEIEDFVAVAAYAVKNGTQLLDAKYHMFIKACADPDK